MNIVRFDPWREFDGFFSRPVSGSGQPANWVPAVDISENDSEYLIELELPAVTSEDVSVSVEKGVLNVSGERAARAGDTDKPVRRERRYGKFSRAFRLPENVNEEQIQATFRDGVLTVVLTKSVQEEPRRIQINAA